MTHDSINLNLCSKCRNPLSFKPRIDIDFRSDPSISNSLELQETISLCDEDLDDYDAQIICLQIEILHLQAQKKRLSDYKTLVESSLPLFRKLPNEILCTIFESACAENLLQLYPWPPTLHPRPTDCFLPCLAYLPSLAISAVCTRWRSVALASPGLWSQLRLETCRSEEALASGFVSTLRLYLNRSVDAPLSILIVAQGKDYRIQNRIPPALNLLLDHANHWRTFSYTGDDELRELIGPDFSFPMLENLTLKGGRTLMRLRNFELFEDAPKLLTVTTERHSVDPPRSWNQITSLQILSPPLPEAMDSLQRYPNLMNLTLAISSYGFGTGIISLAKLRSFTLVEFPYNQKDTSLSDMFSTMTLPSLMELVIDSKNDQPRLIWPPDAFKSFISRSMCTLTTLSLRHVTIEDQLLLATFRILPSLVHFRIDDWVESPILFLNSPLTKRFMLSMSASSRTPVLPKLRSISITAYSPIFDDAAFVDMVSSRWLPGPSAAAKGIACLRSLVLRLPMREVDEEVYRPLENLDKMGMQVVVIGKCATDD